MDIHPDVLSKSKTISLHRATSLTSKHKSQRPQLSCFLPSFSSSFLFLSLSPFNLDRSLRTPPRQWRPPCLFARLPDFLKNHPCSSSSSFFFFSCTSFSPSALSPRLSPSLHGPSFSFPSSSSRSPSSSRGPALPSSSSSSRRGGCAG